MQFCGHDPEILLKAGKIVEGIVPAIDINLGCPQGIAKKGYYGSFLLENTELVLKIAGYLCNNLKCAVTCKIRIFNQIEKSVELAKKLQVLLLIINKGMWNQSIDSPWKDKKTE
jgi:tRNA-dihydrouridine synthase 1